MLSREQTEKYAEVLLWALDVSRGEPLAPGSLAALRWDMPAMPLAEAVYALLVDRHINTVQRVNLSARMERDFYHAASPGQLVFQTPGDAELNRHLDGSIHLLAPQSLTHLSDVDPQAIGAVAAARKPLRDILEEREQGGLYGWTLCMWPTEALAASAGMSIDDYAACIASACYLNKADPVMEWRHVLKRVKELRTWLDGLGAETFRVESEHVDLTVRIGELRRWLGVTGHNIPSFELYVSPDWRGTSGVYYADQPSFRSGNYVRGVRLEFRDGTVVAADAEEGGEFLRKQVSMDQGSGRVGEFSLTDTRFSPIDRFMASTLFDENFGGTHGNCHLALGSSYPGTYSGSQRELSSLLKEELGFNSSALHWDLVNTEPKTVTAKLHGGGTRVIYENGRFAI
ncbi:aminopeptidase [Desulfobaculum xiamenense]|uniref:Aminopeptidase n=1 Tax=Desulfobaculum xiamenense TaxID=995050 RepID=A0A846QK85_9BACT|nr:aminopeptidase [Desulfobaculum xiamenense]NJB66593.1 aminopeptidase [Desulfobaculum xiamenense]